MEPQLPTYPSNPVFLSPMEEHNRLLLNLNTSSVFQPIHPGAPSLTTLKQLLASRYGGSTENWNIRPVANSLVKIPDRVFSDDPYLDEDYWALYHLQVLPWQTLEGAEQAPPRLRIMVTIRDFPIDAWHPIYFRQATVTMGVMLGFLANTMTTGNMARARLLIACPNTDIIPSFISVHHMNKITHCPVEWEPLPKPEQPPFPPNSPPPPLNYQPNINPGDQPQLPPNPPPNPNRLPSPIRICRLPIPQPDPNQRAPSAATLANISKKKIPKASTIAANHTPSPPNQPDHRTHTPSAPSGEKDKSEQTVTYGKVISRDEQLALKVGEITILSETYHVTRTFFQIGDFHLVTQKCLTYLSKRKKGR